VIGGIVAYDNRVKVDALGVPEDVIAAHGAVSEAVAELMAIGALNRFAADLAVAITGIAGPSGGTPTKPVGTVAIALAGPHPSVRTLRLPGDRHVVRSLAVAAALDLLRRASA
jgi:nicotinamide-nucleotide amidase